MTPRPAPQEQRLPATTIAVGEAGIALMGPSGSGKSSLAIALVDACTRHGFARLVADDVTRISAAGGRIVARPVPRVAGLIERRGLGITPMDATGAVVLRLVVDCLGTEPQRLPEPEMLVTTLLGVTLPRLAVTGQPRDVSLILAALELMHSGRSS